MLIRIKEQKWAVFLVAFILVLTVILLIPKVTLEKRLLQSGKHHQAQHEILPAVEDFERAVHYAPQSLTGLEAARLGGELCLYEAKDYPRAIFFFRHIVRHSQRVSEVRWAQQKLAEIFYEKLNNYSQAIVEYQRLLQASPAKDEAAEYKLRLARSYFYLGNFDQAISEATEFANLESTSPKVFDMLMLKANALLAQKKTDEAIESYSHLEAQFPNREGAYEVKLNKSLAYEDKKDWDKAIQVLQEVKDKYPHPDVIALKIKSIERRKARKKEM